jgi:Fe-S-cluster-containing dehydrogenase component
MHCRNAPCVNLCPFGSAYTQKNGIVRIDDRTCFGGAKCKKVCPWHIPQRQSGVGLHLDVLPQYAGNGIMYKCDRCYQKVAQGELPACIEACPEDVQEIGPRQVIIEKAKALVADSGGFLYGAEENGGTNTIYVSPVPFEVLNQSIATAPGQPHFKSVADSMAAPNRMAAALALAPVAGLIGAATRFKRTAENLTTKEY